MTRMRLSFVTTVAVLALVACGPSTRNNNGDDGDDTVDAAPPDAYCPTTVSGKVFAPNGTLPLYNVTVYAPTSDPPPFPTGVQCGQCSTTLPGGAYASASSDAEGKFKLEGVPVGFNVPIIVTTGKWRRKFVIPEVAPCTETVIPDGEFRLPRNRLEGELPRIAVVTGGCDALACILPKIGIDASEYSDNAASGAAVTFFSGAGGDARPNAQLAETLYGNLNELKKFDVLINTCECSAVAANKPSPDIVRQYADIGGRVLGSHFHHNWTSSLVPQWAGTATWGAGPSGSTTGPEIVDQAHPVGMILAKWMMAVGASTQLGVVNFAGAQLNNHVTAVAPTSTRWIHSTGVVGQAPRTHYLSFNTPVGLMPENQCGKVVYAAPHVSGDDGAVVAATNFPTSCGANFTAAEKAFTFLIFDLTTCLNPIF